MQKFNTGKPTKNPTLCASLKPAKGSLWGSGPEGAIQIPLAAGGTQSAARTMERWAPVFARLENTHKSRMQKSINFTPIAASGLLDYIYIYIYKYY